MKSFQQHIASLLTSINTQRVFTLASLILFSLNSFAGNYTWTGATSTSWTTTTNWTPNGNPSTNDTVKIKAATRNCLLGANTTVKEFTLTSDTIDLGGNTLTVTNNLTFTTGFITNGTLTCIGAGTASLGGGTISVTLNVTANSIQFSGGTYNNAVTAVKKGSGSSTGTGGCTFSSTVSLTDSGSGAGSWTLANTTSDTWNDKVTVTQAGTGTILLSNHGSSNSFLKSVTFKNTSTGNIYCDNYGTSSFHDSLIVNSTGGGDIVFGLAGGITTLDTSIIVIGSSGFSSSGELYLGGIKQLSATKAISLTLTGTAEIRFLTGTEFDGRLTVSSPHLFLDGGRFLGVTTLTHTGTNTNTSVGLCYFADSTYITHDATSGSFYLGVTKVDTFDAPVTILNDTLGKVGVIKAVFLDKAIFIDHAKLVSGVGTAVKTTFLVGDAGSCTFHDSLTLKSDSADMVFGTSAGAIDFKDSAYIKIDSSYIGDLKFRNTTQHGSHAVNVPFQNNSGVLYLDSASTFNAAVTCHVKRVQLNGTTFNSSFSLTRNGTDNDTSAGGNTFNGNTTIIDSNSTTGKVLALANKYTDDFNGQVIFRQYGSGKILPALTKNTTFAGDIVVDGNSDITFGYGGGKVILDDTSNRVLSKLGSNYPIFKKLEMKKNAGTFTLTMPLTVTDSVIFTKGYLITDSVHLLIIPDNGIVSGANDSSLVIGSVMKSGNDAFTFPLGIDGFYHPLSISAPTGGAFTAKYVFGSHGLSSNSDTTIENESLCEYWKVQRDTGTSKVLVRLGWNSNSCNVFGKDSMRVAVWDTTTTKWKDKGNSGTTGTLSVGTVISNDSLNLFGIVTLADKFCTSLKPVTTSTDVTCRGNSNGTAHVSASGATPPYSYSWSPRSGGSIGLWDLPADLYFVTVIDSRGCTLMDSVYVNNPDSIHVSISSTASDCHDSTGTAKLITSGGSSDTYHYLWTLKGETGDSIGGLPAGIYEVRVTDLKGCSIDTSVNISDSDGPAVEIDSLINVKCFGGNTGLVTIICPECPIGDPIDIWPPCGIPNPAKMVAGTFPFVTEDSSGCKTIISVTISEPPKISLSVSSTLSSCGDSTGSAMVIATGGTNNFTYQWSSGGTDSLETNLVSGFDTLVVTDDNGCTAKAIVAVVDSNGPTINKSITNISCFGDSTGSIIITPSGGAAPYNFYWDREDLINDTLNNLIVGSYSVLVVDSNGCKNIDTAIVETGEQININFTKTDASADSISDGSISLMVSGGTIPYSYYWSNGASSSAISGLGAGDYTAYIIDANSCMQTARFAIQPNNDPYLLSIQCDNYTYGAEYPRPCGNACATGGLCVPCSFTSSVTFNIQTDFGAVGDGVTDDEGAFEWANYIITEYYCSSSTAVTLYIPAGTYLVGRQDPVGVNGNSGGLYRRGHHIFCFNDCSNVTIEGIPDVTTGALPILKYKDCMKMGAFDPATGKRHLHSAAICGYTTGLCSPTLCTGPVNNPCSSGGPNCCCNPDPSCICDAIGRTWIDGELLADVGNCFNLYNCDQISIKNLELFGNSFSFSIGGYYAYDFTGFQPISHSAFIISNSTNIKIENINAHEFALDGVQISDARSPWTDIAPMQVVLLNTKFDTCGRSGMSWVSGSGVKAINCEFKYAGFTPWGGSATRNGVDIEYEGGRSLTDGGFYNCQFKYNAFCAIESDATNWPPAYINTHDFFFKKCVFVAGEDGNAAWPNAKNFTFKCCDFYGHIPRVFDATEDPLDPDFPNNWNTKFLNCTFNEEYTDPEIGITYAHTYFDVNNCASFTASHKGLFELTNPYGRVFFDGCSFNTNAYNNWGTFIGSTASFNGNFHPNFMVIRNSSFSNYGLFPYAVHCVNDKELAAFSAVDLSIGNSAYAVQNPDLDFGVCGGTFPCSLLLFNTCLCNAETYCYWVAPCSYIDGTFPLLYGNCYIWHDPTAWVTKHPCQPKYQNPTFSYSWTMSGAFNPPTCATLVDEYCTNPPTCDTPPTGCFCPECTYPPPAERIRRQQGENLSISPVPANNKLLIGNVNSGEEIFLTDVFGNTIKRYVVIDNSIEIFIENLPVGLYFIRATNHKVSKFVKYD